MRVFPLRTLIEVTLPQSPRPDLIGIADTVAGDRGVGQTSASAARLTVMNEPAIRLQSFEVLRHAIK